MRPEQGAGTRAQVFAQTVREKGAGGLFTGMGPRVTQTALMSAVFFSLFEWWKAQLKRCAPAPARLLVCLALSAPHGIGRHL